MAQPPANPDTVREVLHKIEAMLEDAQECFECNEPANGLERLKAINKYLNEQNDLHDAIEVEVYGN